MLNKEVSSHLHENDINHRLESTLQLFSTDLWWSTEISILRILLTGANNYEASCKRSELRSCFRFGSCLVRNECDACLCAGQQRLHFRVCDGSSGSVGCWCV